MPVSKVSQLPLPSFSLVITRSSLQGATPVELLAMKDFRQASRRELHLNLQPADDDPLMKTVDTRFAGSFAYDVVYTTEPRTESLYPTEDVTDTDTTNETGTQTESVLYSDSLDSDIECSPVHRQPPSVESLAQMPPHIIFTSPALPIPRNPSRGSRSPVAKASWYAAATLRLLNILKILRSFWHRLRKVGGALRRVCGRR